MKWAFKQGSRASVPALLQGMRAAFRNQSQERLSRFSGCDLLPSEVCTAAAFLLWGTVDLLRWAGWLPVGGGPKAVRCVVGFGGLPVASTL